MFIMLDGIDGSGKSTIIDTWKEYLAASGNAIFDLKKYILETGHLPEISELNAYEFIFSCEPTYVGIGKVIREELIKNGTSYPPLAIAEAYSLDRLVLYTKVIIPLLRADKCVIQDRGISSSLAYQTLQEGLDLNTVSSLPGNQLALKHRPDYLVLTDIDPSVVMDRLAKRTEKQDDVIFEKIAFQTKLAKQFTSPSYQKVFTNAGSKILSLSVDKKIDIMKAEAVALLKNILTI